jgi:hypothetical protein
MKSPTTVAAQYARTARHTALKKAFRKIALMSASPPAREPNDFRAVQQLCNTLSAIIRLSAVESSTARCGARPARGDLAPLECRIMTLGERARNMANG